MKFERGDKVSLILAAANLDPLKFSDPLTFKPDRAEAPNLSLVRASISASARRWRGWN